MRPAARSAISGCCPIPSSSTTPTRPQCGADWSATASCRAVSRCSTRRTGVGSPRCSKPKPIPMCASALQEALSQLDRTRVEGGGGTTISFEAADQLVRARVKKTQAERLASAPRRRRSPKVAAEALVDEDRAEDVAAIVENLQTLLNALDEGKLRPETIRTKLPDGTTEAVTTARLDLLNLLGKVLGEDTYGGLIEVDAPDLESALRRFDVEQHLIARWHGDRIGEFLEHLSDDEAGAALARCFADVRRRPRGGAAAGCGHWRSSRWRWRHIRRTSRRCSWRSSRIRGAERQRCANVRDALPALRPGRQRDPRAPAAAGDRRAADRGPYLRDRRTDPSPLPLALRPLRARS